LFLHSSPLVKLVQVGDWGYVDKKTATFVKEGNIFTDHECAAVLGYIEKPILYCSPEGTCCIFFTTTQIEITSLAVDVIRFEAKAASAGGGESAVAL
jgi:hypothetical protein